MFEHNLRAKVTAKDKEIFEDDSLNTRIEDRLWESLDQNLASMENLKNTDSNWILDAGLGNDMLEIKATALNTRDIYGPFRTFFPSKV